MHDPRTTEALDDMGSEAPNDRKGVERSGTVVTETVGDVGTRNAVLPLLEETLQFSKRRFITGRVRVSTHTETYDELAETTLNHSVVDITRVPVGLVVDVAPEVRTEGDTTIVPVFEERLVMVKQLFLVEELHIRHQVEQQQVKESVPLRRQHSTIERLDADDRSSDPTPSVD